jgi:hypothetical protein
MAVAFMGGVILAVLLVGKMARGAVGRNGRIAGGVAGAGGL